MTIVFLRFCLVNICQKYNFDWGELLVLKLDMLSKILLMSDLSSSVRDFLFHFAALCKIFSAYINDTTTFYWHVIQAWQTVTWLSQNGLSHKRLSQTNCFTMIVSWPTVLRLMPNCVMTNCLTANCLTKNCLTKNCLTTNCLTTMCLMTDCLAKNCLKTNRLIKNCLFTN